MAGSGSGVICRNNNPFPHHVKFLSTKEYPENNYIPEVLTYLDDRSTTTPSLNSFG